MKSTLRILFVVAMVIGSIMLYGFIGYEILMPMYIPDYCYYDSREIPAMVDFWFDFPSAAGYHPVPTYWGYLIFAVLGGFVGRYLGRKIIKRENT